MDQIMTLKDLSVEQMFERLIKIHEERVIYNLEKKMSYPKTFRYFTHPESDYKIRVEVVKN